MRILMVCLGNICRSPLAEGIMKQHAAARGLDWQVDSAGTGGWHDGQLADRRSIAVARQHGLDISQQRARQINKADFGRFDRIFVMDQQNFRDVQRLAATDADRAKITLLLDEAYPGEGREVPDPYHDDDGFEAVFQMIDAACDAFVRRQMA